MPFQVTLAEGSWWTDDLTLDEAVVIEQETGESWLTLNPARSAEQARSIIRRFLARSLGEDTAADRAGAMTLRDVADALRYVEQDDRPKQHVDGAPVVDPKAAAGAPATT